MACDPVTTGAAQRRRTESPYRQSQYDHIPRMRSRYDNWHSDRSKPAEPRGVRISLLGLIGAGFIFCKCAGVTDIAQWSWVWVLAPLWGEFVLTLLVAVGVVMFDIKRGRLF